MDTRNTATKPHRKKTGLAIVASFLLSSSAWAFHLLAALIVLVIIIAVVVGPIAAPEPSATSTLTEIVDDLEEDVEALSVSMDAVSQLASQIAIGKSESIATSLATLGADRSLQTLADAIRNAKDIRAYIKQRRSEVRAAVAALGNGLVAVSADLNTVGNDFSGVGIALAPIGSQISNRSASVWSPRLRCTQFPLGPSVANLGTGINNSGRGFGELGNSFNLTASVLGAIGRDLLAFGNELDQGGQSLAEVRSRLTQLLADVQKIAPAATAVGNGINSVAGGFFNVSTGLNGIGSQLQGYASCRDGLVHILPGRRERNLARNQKIRNIGTNFLAMGTRINGSATELQTTGNKLAAGGSSISVSGQGLGNIMGDRGLFDQFVNNFATCSSWMASAPEYSRFPMQLDTHAGYAAFTFRRPQTRSLALRISGSYPHAVFANYTTYKTQSATIHRSLLDRDIVANAGSTNPFIVGNPINVTPRDYQVVALPAGSPYLGKLANSTIELADDATPMIVLRVYQPQNGFTRFGGKSVQDPSLDLPIITAVSADDLARPAVCPMATVPTPSINRASSFQPPLPVDDNIYFYRTPYASTPLPDGETPDACTTYLNATVDANRISIVRLPRVPIFFNNKTATAVTAFQETEARYISMSVTGASNNYQRSQVSVPYPSPTTYTMHGSISGPEIKVRPDGSAIFALISPTLPAFELSLALKRANDAGYNLLSLPAASQNVSPFIVYRMKVPRPTFAGKTSQAPCHGGDLATITPAFSASGDPKQAMGDYAPRGQQCYLENFIDGTCGQPAGSSGQTGLGIDASYPNEVRFIAHLYRDFLGRSAAAGEISAWLNVYQSQGRAAVARGVLYSQEHKDAFINELFKSMLKRDGGKNNPWTAGFEQAFDHMNMSVGIAGSAESLTTNGGCQGLVGKLYTNFLGRTADAGGLAAWTNECQLRGPAAAARGIAYSTEAAHTQVRRWYDRYLGRAVDSGALTYFVNERQAGRPLLQMLMVIANSDEYFQRK